MDLLEVVDFLEEYAHCGLTFGLEYSKTVDWVAEFVPGCRHPLARQYNGPWREQHVDAEEAIGLAKKRFLEMWEERFRKEGEK